MFEGLVRQLILGYLGRYVKDIQKDQLKITVWNEEVLLENVELILESFDYLQLPLTLKEGRVGKLCIRIPWKKLGWEPIIIILEDVFISASQRSDQEWSSDAIEKRQFAGKKAKLAAAELAKLSRRMCDNKTGNPFISYIAAKILDSIQVSIRNFHIQYNDVQPHSVLVMFGLRFSSLTITKHNLAGSSSAKVRGGQVNKTVEIEALDIYCNTYDDTTNFVRRGSNGHINFDYNSIVQSDKCDHIVKPFNVSATLLVNRSVGLYKDLPQNSVYADVTGVVLCLNEIQLQQILVLLDNLQTSRLREKYGRYRPYDSSKKPDGWRKLWWRYAQQSILSDVRERLKKTSWRYLGQRLSNHRKYVNLYKIKLDFLQQEQPVDESILWELEQMEKELDIDDILTYRSAAENELQNSLSKSAAKVGTYGVNSSVERAHIDERSLGRSRGWLNWLSRGMLGAGGTDDSSQFSGVIPDEVVKDIHEATEFDPLVSSTTDCDANDMIYTFAVRFSMQDVSLKLHSVYSRQEIAVLDLSGGVIDAKLWEELATITLFIDSGGVINPRDGKDILKMPGPCLGITEAESGASCKAQVEMSSNQDVGLSVKVVLQPVEVVYDKDVLSMLIKFFTDANNFKLQHERVLSSLNGLEDVKSRLTAKAECVLSERTRIKWDISIVNIIINVPYENAASEQYNLVFSLGSLCLTSKCGLDSLRSSNEEQSYITRNFPTAASSCNSFGFQLKDLYDLFEVQLNNIELKLMVIHHSQTVAILEKFSLSFNVACCIISDGPIMTDLENFPELPMHAIREWISKEPFLLFVMDWRPSSPGKILHTFRHRLLEFKVNADLSSIHVNFSPSVYKAVVAVVPLLDIQNSISHDSMSASPWIPAICVTMHAKLPSVSLHVDLANGENSSVLIVSLQESSIWYSLQEFQDCWIRSKALGIRICPSEGEKDSHILCSTDNIFANVFAQQQDADIGHSEQSYNFDNRTTSDRICFQIHYKTCRSVGLVCHKLKVSLIDTNLHCYPYVFGLLAGFHDKLSSDSTSIVNENSNSLTVDANAPRKLPCFEFERYGASNFFQSGSCEYACIPLELYPFVTIYNSGSLGSLDTSLVYSIPDWRESFNLRDKEYKECNLKRQFSSFNGSRIESTSGVDASLAAIVKNLFVIDMDLCGIKIHFHETSDILGTIKLPTCTASLVIEEDCMDMVCTMIGLNLTSTRWAKSSNDLLWGPSSLNLSPIMNLRVRRGDFGSPCSLLEVSIGVQHVCCILPSEYLASIIDYFSLADWSSDISMAAKSNNGEQFGTHNEPTFTYKFEALDSILNLPVGGNSLQYLSIDIQQLYCSYIHNCAVSNLVQDIPSECVVPIHKAGNVNHCLSIFGRDLSLSFMLSQSGGYDGLVFDQDTGYANITLLAAASVDVWIRIPHEDGHSSASTCIMSKIGTCQFVAHDFYGIWGIEVLLNIIDQFSSMQEGPKSSTTDAFEFTESNRCLEEETADSPVNSAMTFTEVRCVVDSLLIKLDRLKNDSVLLEPVANFETKFLFSASFQDLKPISLDLSVSSIQLYSLYNSVILAQCTVISSKSSVFDASLSETGEGVNELRVSCPALNIWLHLYDWERVIDLCDSYSKKLSKRPPTHLFLTGSTISTINLVESVLDSGCQMADQSSSLSSDVVNKNKEQEIVFLIVKSENIGLTFHVPFWVREVAFSKNGVKEGQKRSEGVSNITNRSEQDNFISVTVHSQSSELSLSSTNATLESVFDDFKGTVGILESGSFSSWSLFKISQVSVTTEIKKHKMEPLHASVGVQFECLDMCLTHKVISLCHGIEFRIPESGAPQSTFGSLEINIQLNTLSFLILDGRWSSSGPLFEILMRNILLQARVTENIIETSTACNFEVNYNNIHKVLWEPFIEAWKFELKMIIKNEINGLSNCSLIFDINLASSDQLNLNITESLIECVFRTTDMMKDAWGLMRSDDIPENQNQSKHQCSEKAQERRYAPYVLQNLTSLPLVYRVYQGLVGSDYLDVSKIVDEKSIQPDASVPIYIDDTSDDQLYLHRERKAKKRSNGVIHHLMTIQLDGTSMPSVPSSMDLVGLTFFDVDFSKPSSNKRSSKENEKADSICGFVVPVVFDVSMQRHSKLIRLYSTVIIMNSTSMPLELRFDIPFGLSPKILDPVYPGQEFPVPLHLAEAGRMRWRPLGNSYLWSEAQSISNVLSQENKIGFLRSFVCYPSHPSNEPFRCCISVQSSSLAASRRPTTGQMLHELDHKKRFIYQVCLSTPLIVNNYLPEPLSLTIESGGISHTAFLSEAPTPFHNIDPAHDLGFVINMNGYKPAYMKFPRTESANEGTKLSGSQFCQVETLCFDPCLSGGPIYVTIEKVVNLFSGAREVVISVPFLLYNCSGITLLISDCTNGISGTCMTIPSCYDFIEQETFQPPKEGLSIFSSNHEVGAKAPNTNNPKNSSPNENIILSRRDVNSHIGRFLSKPFLSSTSSQPFSSDSLKTTPSSNSKDPGELNDQQGKVKACIYSPQPIFTAGEVRVRTHRCLSGSDTEIMPSALWSGPFPMVTQSGSSSVLVPQSSSNAVFILSVTCSNLAGALAGRTRAITFQPRFVISNACGKDICFKQKGTDLVFHLGIGKHSHLHWADTTRELLVSISFNDPGWQWSGSFLPDRLGDTQVKMRNYISGATRMMRIEVQNADISIQDEKIVGTIHGNSGTNLILISDDDTGYMPYRIDNFSKERLRIYQQKCETFDTILHPYTSNPYAWDEPCYPHRLLLEVPGERVIGSYALDDLKEYMPVRLQSTTEKPERTFILSIFAEGATKVLSIVDSNYHVLKDTNVQVTSIVREKGKQEQKQDKLTSYTHKLSLVIPYLGISLINSSPEELLFACAKNITIDLLQSLHQHKLSLQVSSFQLDNQLRRASHPVILSFSHEYRNNPTSQRTKDSNLKSSSKVVQKITTDSWEPVIYLALAKWRKRDVSLVSFEYISLRMAEFHLDLEQEVILNLLDFIKNISPTSESRVLEFSDPTLHLICDVGSLRASSSHEQTWEHGKVKGNVFHKKGIIGFSGYQKNSAYIPSIVPIGAPWQQIYLLARRQRKLYVELFDVAPIAFTFSFSSAPWMLRNGLLAPGESLIHRGLMALADIEGARIYLKQLTISHHIASWESFEEILFRHYVRQLLHEMYKVFGSAGVIGNPMGFARSVGLGIKDFLSVPTKSGLKNPARLITGMAQGTTSLLSNTVFALSDATTQFSKAAHKGIVAFTFDDHAVARMEKQQKGAGSHSKGVINEVFEGLTGLLQSPIKEAEKHGLPGIFSGIALGVTGLVAKPAASILEVTGRTAQSIRNRSKLYTTGPRRYRVRLPRTLSKELPLRPYSWEQAVGTSVLIDADSGSKLKSEVLVMCKALKQDGKFIIITRKLVLVVSCSSLVDIGKPEFQGVSIDPDWVIETEISLESIIHADADDEVVHIVGSCLDGMSSQQPSKKGRAKKWNVPSTPLPLLQTNLDLGSKEEAEDFLQALLSTIETGKGRGWGSRYLLHRSQIK